MKRTAIVLIVLSLFLSACATGGPAASGARTRCADDAPGDPLRPMVFLFCFQSP